MPQLCCLVPPADGGPTGLAQSRLDSVGGGPGPLWAGREGAGPSPRSWTGVQRLKTRSPATCPLGPYLQVSLEVDSGVLRGSLPSGKPGRQWGACGCRHPTRCLCPLQSHRLRVQALTPCSPCCPSTALAPHPLLRDGGWASRDTSQPLAKALPHPAPRCHSRQPPPPPSWPWAVEGAGTNAAVPRDRRRTGGCFTSAWQPHIPAGRARPEQGGGGGLGGDSRETGAGAFQGTLHLVSFTWENGQRTAPRGLCSRHAVISFSCFFSSIQKSELRKERDRADIFLSVHGSALGRAGERQSS